MEEFYGQCSIANQDGEHKRENLQRGKCILVRNRCLYVNKNRMTAMGSFDVKLSQRWQNQIILLYLHTMKL